MQSTTRQFPHWMFCVTAGIAALLVSSIAGLAQGPISNGNRIDAALGAVGEVDTWTMECPIDGQLYIQVAEVAGTNFEPKIELYALGGSTPLSSNSGTDSTNILRSVTAGTYLIKVMDATNPADGNGSYTIHAALPGMPFTSPPSDEGGSLSNGATVNGQIDLADIDLFSFEAQPGEEITLKLTQLSGSVNFTPRISIFTPSGVLYSSGTDMYYNVTMGGTHTVMIRDTSTDVQNSGTYRLNFLRPRTLPVEPSGSNGQVLKTGQIYSGSISATDEIDYYFIEASYGESITCKLEDAAADGFRPNLRIYRPDGSLARSHAHNLLAYTQITATLAGRYAIVVTDANRSIGTYSIGCSHPPETPVVTASDEGGSIPNGGYVDGVIGVGDMDFYTLDVVAGERIQLQLAELSDNLLVPEIVLYSPKGEFITQSLVPSYSSTGTTASLGFNTELGGNYTVMVADSTANNSSSPGTGSYRLHLALMSQPFTTPRDDQGGLLTSGNHYDGTIDAADMDIYYFEADAGNTVCLEAAPIGTGNLAPIVQVYDHFGRQIAASSNDEIKIKHAGRYAVLVFDLRSAVVAGDYRLFYSKSTGAFSTPAGDEGGSLTPNTTTTGTITEADSDLFSFSANAGDAISFAFTDHDADSFYPYFVIYDSNGKALALTYSQSTYSVNIALTGSYAVVIGDTIGRTGTYQFLFTKTPGSPSGPTGTAKGAIANGGQVSANMTFFQEKHLWAFEATAGNPVWLMFLGQGMPSNPPAARIFSPSGGLVYKQDSGPNMISSRFVAVESGTYTIELKNNSSSLSYTFSYLSPSTNYTIPQEDDGGQIVPGVKSSASLNVGDIDVWEFTAQAGEKVFLKMGDPTGTGLNPSLEVHQPDGLIAALNDAGYNSSTCEFIARQPGRYLVLASSYDPGDSGDYNLFLTIAGNAYVPTVDEQGRTLEAGVLYNASISYGDMDLWNFNAQAGDRIHLGAAAADGSGLQVRLDVHDPDGTRIVLKDGGAAPYAIFTAAKAGSYTVKIDHSENRSGTYNISYANLSSTSSIPEGDRKGVLRNGVRRDGVLGSGDVDIWTFDANQNEWIWLQVGGGVGSMAVYDPNGRLAEYDNSLLEYELITQEAGTYTVVISNDSFASVAGTYQVHFSRIGSTYNIISGDDGGGVEDAETKTATIGIADMDMWSFHAMTGEWVTIQANELSGSSFSPYIAVYSPEGIKITSGYNATLMTITFRAPSTGVYTVLVRNYGNNYGNGVYEFVATGMTPAPVAVYAQATGQSALRLAWPSPSSGWTLQESPTMLQGTWSTSALVPVDNGYEKSVEFDTTSANRFFYRLAKP